MTEHKISTRFNDGKVLATAKVAGRKRQATVKGGHDGTTHAQAAFDLCERAGIVTRVKSNITVKEVPTGFDFTIRVD